jgi:polar amino acid transport system substrate-binding protein
MAAVGVLAALAGAGEVSAETGACADPLAVGYTEWPPFDIPTSDGLSGINGDILSAVAQRMGCRVTWHQRPWKRVLAELRRGELDVTGAAHRTATRAQYAHFSESYLPYKAVLFVDSEDSSRYSRLRRFLETRQSLGVVRGHTYGERADALLGREKYAEQIYRMYAAAENVRALAKDRVGGILGNPHVLNYLAHAHGVGDDLRQTEAVVQAEPIHFMFSKRAVAEPVVQRFDKALKALRAEGRIREIVRRHTHPDGTAGAEADPAPSADTVVPFN